MQQLSEDIRPSADLRNHYSEISKECREERKAVVITVNGRGDTAVLGYEQWQGLKARIELLELLSDAEDDFSNGRVQSSSKSFAELRAELKRRSESAEV